MKVLKKLSYLIAIFLILLINALNVHSESTDTLTLDECIDLAIENSLVMEQYRLDKTFAHADSLMGFGSLLPNISTSLSFTRSWGHTYSGDINWEEFGIPPQSGVSNSYQFRATLNQPLIAPLNIFTFLGSRANSKAQDISYELSTEDMIITSAEAYFSLIKMEALHKAAEISYQASQKHLEYAKVLSEVGGASQIDVTKAQTSERQAKLNLIQAESNLEKAKMSLNYLIGRDVDEELIIEIPEEILIIDYDYDRCLEVAFINRQDIEQYEQLKKATKYYYAGSIASKFPQIYGNFSYYWNDDELQTENWGRNDGYSLGITLSLDLFDNFNTEASIIKKRASYILSNMSYDQIKQDIQRDVREAYLGWIEASKSLDVAEAYVEETDYELELAERRYQLSAGSIIELTDAQASFYTSQTEYQDALYNYYISTIELAKAMGVLDEYIDKL
jgi:outer membrane protein